jgi:hypothetical protein
MVDPSVQEHLVQEDDSHIDSIILEPPSVGLDDFSPGASKRERLRLLEERHGEFITRLTDQLRDADVKVASLPVTGQVIVTGAVAKLKKLICKGGTLEKDPNVKVFPNIRLYPLSGP